MSEKNPNMSEKKVNNYIKSIGASILKEANNVKRTLDLVCKETGIAKSDINSIVDGTSTIEHARKICFEISSHYPIPIGDIWIEHDDTIAGVALIKKEDSEASGRVMTRIDSNGKYTPYYKYLDTGCSRLGPFKPEKIYELRIVNDNTGNNPNVQYNNGHLLHQTTLHIGKVNFYANIDGNKKCHVFNTGDSNYITPWVPHSFTKRDEEEGYILAITYAGGIAKCLSGMAHVDTDSIDKLCGNLSIKNSVFKSTIERYLDYESMEKSMLYEKYNNKNDLNNFKDVVEGKKDATMEHIKYLALIFNIKISDLMLQDTMKDQDKVGTKFYKDSLKDSYYYPSIKKDYHMIPLVRNRFQPQLKPFIVRVPSTTTKGATFKYCLHSYIFNYGQPSVELIYGTKKLILKNGDSLYMAPLIQYSINYIGINDEEKEQKEDAPDATLYVVRCPGDFQDATLTEYSAFSKKGRKQTFGQTTCWYNNEDKINQKA